MSEVHLVAVTVNGRRHEVAVEARRTLADFLRHDLGYTGTHLGCEHGICGACTVLVDGEPVARASSSPCRPTAPRSRRSRAWPARTRSTPCRRRSATPCAAVRLLHAGLSHARDRAAARQPQPDRDEIRDAMASNLCRCTGYQSILAAVRAAADGEPQPG